MAPRRGSAAALAASVGIIYKRHGRHACARDGIVPDMGWLIGAWIVLFALALVACGRAAIHCLRRRWSPWFGTVSLGAAMQMADTVLWQIRLPRIALPASRGGARCGRRRVSAPVSQSAGGTRHARRVVGRGTGRRARNLCWCECLVNPASPRSAAGLSPLRSSLRSPRECPRTTAAHADSDRRRHIEPGRRRDLDDEVSGGSLQQLPAITFWLMGSLAASTWRRLRACGTGDRAGRRHRLGRWPGASICWRFPKTRRARSACIRRACAPGS